MTAGSCWLSIEDAEPFLMKTGDFVLLPATPGFRMGSDLQALESPTVRLAEASDYGEARHGVQEVEPAVRMLGGYFVFDPTNAPLLVGLLPTVVHIKATDAGSARLGWIASAIGEETAADKPGGDAILTRLVEVMLIEALRWQPAQDTTPISDLLSGLADSRLAAALRHIHDDVARRWTIEDLGSKVGMSRASFAARFTHVLGIPPMEYVLRWRMALAKDLLWHDGLSLGEVAQAIGYQSTSAFSAAFSRFVGVAPGSFARSGHIGSATGSENFSEAD
ncbi:bacterial regulatory helix-turn-helix s, AraC family protein [Collimonas arenae]|uniref:Bacterial regulatory helix-turn-helix s, AraC family protein n=2 Tax=Collimonas arenae TaxID=279058 RepID=A0A127QE25_9BURK|nr:bacterial regulatory helix-turn-helix s, AraC family protein [Collimonas arenae]AMP08095.1 bacterial regulatory helix-turn-helix s, AraC family protein [Collimonas arenae]